MDEVALQTEECIVTAADGGRFRITHVTTSGAHRPPLVYLPGMFSGRTFWLSSRGIGLAAYLARHGFPGLIVERRGADCGARAGLDEHTALDLPLVQQEVERRWGSPAFWIGHSFGGVLAARATAESLEMQRVLGLVLFASQFEVGKYGLRPPLSWLTAAVSRALGRFPARRLGLGPQDEPPAAMLDAIRLVCEGRRNAALGQTLSRITVPVLALSGLADRVDPTSGCQRLIAHFGSHDKRFIAAGRAHGFQCDYDHAGIVVSKPAQRELWPLVRDWLAHRSPGAQARSRVPSQGD